MPRDIPVGNNRFLITFDHDYCLRDVFYPHVGKENHTDGHRFRFGVWTENEFHWVSSGWNLRLEYAEESLMSHVTAVHEGLGVILHCNDVVDYREDLYIKTVLVKNLAKREREIRLFFHHDFHILESPAGDTAYYDPDEKAVIHYKGKRYFLMSGMRDGIQGVDQYATGVKEFRGMEGTWRDAEDGWLEGGPISQGSVDSTIGFNVTVPPEGFKTVYYWICAGESYAEVSRLNKMLLGHGLDHFVQRTDNYWRAWISREEIRFGDLPRSVSELYKKSLLILRTNIDGNGAIIAGNDSDVQHFARDTYSYMWPRDGALTAYALDKAGYPGPTRRFFDFCLGIIGSGKESSGYFLHKYNPNGSLGSSWHPWTTKGEKQLPIQEDGTALVLWALWHHFLKSRDVEFSARQYENVVLRCGDFLASYRDTRTGLPLPSYDLWEEQWGIHTFTVSAVHAGLRAAERFAAFFGNEKRKRIYRRAADEVAEAMDRHLYDSGQGRFLKTIFPDRNGVFQVDKRVDASLYAPSYFGVFDARDERVVGTMQAVKERLWVRTDVGGLARYEGDRYYHMVNDPEHVPGNPWFICTLWLVQWYIARAESIDDLHEALPILDWVTRRALPSGVLAEQVHPYTNEPLSVSPLTWSHATFVAAVREYVEKYELLKACPHCGHDHGEVKGGGLGG